MIDQHKEAKILRFKEMSKLMDFFLKLWCFIGAGIGIYGYVRYGMEPEGHPFIIKFFLMNASGAVLAFILTVVERRMFYKITDEL
ncbi:MAG: hypothetical protein CME70_03055 [Halobacteriovorax sp.]|nr:hypothetical protein [Halobacteriovorax sp.]|tara:strand:- start:28901 stop:29155 length:255 start_codon:yes stop_codon:yes gene_type:complete